MMEELSSNENSVLAIVTRRHIPENGILHMPRSKRNHPPEYVQFQKHHYKDDILFMYSIHSVHKLNFKVILVYKFVEKLHLAVNEYKALNGTGLVV
jgi:uncharacterized membrane protein